MRIKLQTDMINHSIALTNKYKRRFAMEEDEQRELITWFFRNKQEMIRDIICEECPEHTSDDKTPYYLNERERGH